MPGLRYIDYTLTLDKGDVLFLYTDGVPEATNSAEEMLGIQGMLDLLNRSGFTDMEQLLGDVAQGVADFTGNTPQFDDVTMMAIRRT